MNTKLSVGLLLGCCGIVIVAVLLSAPTEEPIEVNRPSTKASAGAAAPSHGDQRRMSDLQPIRTAARPPLQLPAADPKQGRIQKIPADANPQVAAVARALQQNQFPERLSVLIPARPFDPDSFAQNPDAYLNVSEPGRVWQAAQPGPDVTRIRSQGSRFRELEQGQTVSLRARVVPRAPVTFTSFDLGEFQNRLTSITVRADEQGIAAARFTATSGTINDVNILAASPLTSGQLKFTVNVRVPQVMGPSVSDVLNN